MSTNAEMRAKAKRKLEEQLERQVRQAQRRRMIVPVAGAFGVFAALAGIILGASSTYHQQATPLAPITTTTTPYTPTTTPTTTPWQPDWKQYCATHIDTVECGNGSDVTTTTMPTTPMPAWPPGSGPCTVHPREAPEGCLTTLPPAPSGVNPDVRKKNIGLVCANLAESPTPQQVTAIVTNMRLAGIGADEAADIIHAAVTSVCPQFKDLVNDAIRNLPTSPPSTTIPGVPGSQQGQAI
jgi:hypothetical protein